MRSSRSRRVRAGAAPGGRGERVTAQETEGEDLRAKAAEMKQAQMRQMVDILTHPSIKNLDPETRTTTIRRGTTLLSGLSSMEQESLTARHTSSPRRHVRARDG
jgi:hypothetical protein